MKKMEYTLDPTFYPIQLILSILIVSFIFNKLGSYIIDNGEYINIFILNQNNPEVYQQLFEVNSFEEITYENINEANESDLNQRVVNIINQMRSDNGGQIQPYRTFFITEKNINNEELKSLLCEDQYKDEVYYVDFLAKIHKIIQDKL